VIIIIGIFLILMGIIFDDITSWVLFLKGFSVLESNPIFLNFGLIPFIISSIILYVCVICVWVLILNYYKKMYKEKRLGWKTYDVFVFFLCVLVVFISGTKIALGFNHINLMVDYFDEDKRIEIENNINIAEEYREANPVEFKVNMKTKYYDGLYNNISYARFWLSVMFGFLLFKIGHKVAPYEYA